MRETRVCNCFDFPVFYLALRPCAFAKCCKFAVSTATCSPRSALVAACAGHRCVQKLLKIPRVRLRDRLRSTTWRGAPCGSLSRLCTCPAFAGNELNQCTSCNADHDDPLPVGRLYAAQPVPWPHAKAPVAPAASAQRNGRSCAAGRPRPHPSAASRAIQLEYTGELSSSCGQRSTCSTRGQK